MKFLIKSLAIAATVLVVATPAHAQRTPEQKAAHKLKAMDGDGDGKVTAEEFVAYRTKWVEEKGKDAKLLEPKSVERAFARHNQNGDGVITKEEIMAMMDDSED